MIDDNIGKIDDDAPLVAAMRRGDIASFETLVRKHQKKMLNIALRIVDDYEDACEVIQDAFVVAFRQLDSFRGDSRFITWLTSITLNLSRNRYQQNLPKRVNEVCFLGDQEGEQRSGRVFEIPAPGPTALELLERSLVHEKLLQCIKMLSIEFREAIILRDLHEYSYRDICSILDIREGTVKSRIFRARDLVKDCLKRGLGAA